MNHFLQTTPFFVASPAQQHRLAGSIRRYLIIFAILLAAISLPILPPRWSVLIILSVSGLAGALMFLYLPQIGLLLLCISGMLLPIDLGTGTNTRLNATFLLAFLLLGLWLCKGLIGRRSIHRSLPAPVVALLCLGAVAMISFAFGQLDWFDISGAPMATQIGELLVFLLSIGAFLMAAYQLGDLRWLRWMTWLFVTIAGVYVLSQALGFRPLTNRLYPWGSTSCMFWLWYLVLVFSHAFFDKGLRPAAQISLIVLLIAGIYVAFIQGFDWKSGWIPGLVGIGVILALHNRKLRILLAACAVCLLPWFLKTMIQLDAYSYATRVDAWKILVDLTSVNLITGLGPANYYWYTALYPIRGYYVQFNSHSQYVDLVAQVGIIGLACYLWFFVAMTRRGLQLRSTVDNGFETAYTYAALGGLAGMIVAGFLGDWILPYVYNVGMVGFRSSILGWLFLGGLLALSESHR